METNPTNPELEPINVIYTNWRGRTNLRRIIPISIRFGTNEWHKEPQWLLRCHDIMKNEEKEFALKDCRFDSANIPTGNA